MATVKNNWVGYLDRSYSQIKTSLLNKLTISNPEMTDHSESNPFIIFVGMFSGVAEMLGYYIDNAAQESFMATATRRSSVIKHTKTLDYRINTASPETVDVIITWSAEITTQFTISAGSSISSPDGITFITLEDFIVTVGSTFSTIPFHQVNLINNSNFALTNGVDNQKFSLGASYVDGSLSLIIDLLEYTQTDSFARVGANDKSFIVDVDTDGNAYFILGNGINGFKPNSGLALDVSYQETTGPEGKVVGGGFDPNTLNLIATLPTGITVSDANSQLTSSGGANYESTESIRTNSVQSIRTMDRMVTWEDHIDVISAVAGVARVGVNFCCGKTIDIYIVPEGGGIASSSLVALAQAEADDKKMITSFPVVKAAGETRLFIGATITAKKRKSASETRTQVEDALIEFGSVENQKINGSIRLSDIQALIDNVTNVDFVDLTTLYTKPYARPSGSNPLVWTNKTLEASTEKVEWRLDYTGGIIRVFRDSLYKGDLAIDSTYIAEDNIIEFSVQAGSYVEGDSWTFVSQPYLANLVLTDFTIFTIELEDINLTINTQSSSTRNPIC